MTTTQPQTTQISKPLASPIITSYPPLPTASTSSPVESSQSPISPSHPLETDSNKDKDRADVPTTGSIEGSDNQNHGIDTPPVPMVHVRALVISGDSHVFSFEPETTVGRMKELIWSMWPSQWREPAQPPSPSFIRILHAGRVLSDDSTLSSNNLPSAIAPTLPTVIHISVRSFSIRAEDDPKKSTLHPVGSRRSRHGNDEDVGGCKCLIM